MNNNLTIWKGLEDLTSDFFGPSRDFDKVLRNIYSSEKHFLNVYTDTVDDDYIIKAEVPGLKEEDLSISYDHDVIKIEADYKEESENVFRTGKYFRSFKLYDIDAENISAQLSDGVLTVILPKAEEKKARKIKINQT